jgi:hypothetical protein
VYGPDFFPFLEMCHDFFPSLDINESPLRETGPRLAWKDDIPPREGCAGGGKDARRATIARFSLGFVLNGDPMP